MPVYGAFEAKNKLSELLDRASRGEEVVISRRGKPEVRIVPITEDSTAQKNAERASSAIEHIRETRAMLRKKGVRFTVEEILALRDEGRRF